MKYRLGPFDHPPDTLTLNPAEYTELVAAKAGIITMVGIEEKFDLLIENYVDYERELLELALRQSLHRDLTWQTFNLDRLAVTRRTANLLSASRSYVDQLKHDLNEALGSTHDVARAACRLLSERYESSLSHRAMEALRNLAQHRSLPVHALGYPSTRVEGEGRSTVRFKAEPRVSVAKLREETLKTSVASELEALGQPTLHLTKLVREYVENLAFVHEEVRKLLAPTVEGWENALRDAHRRCAEQFGGGETRAFVLDALDDQGVVTESDHIFMEPVLYRQAFVRKNRTFVGLAKRFVSGANEEEGD